MSNTSEIDRTPNSYIINLDLIQLNICYYFYPVIVLLGNIGSILNILILTQRAYFHNSCSCYILASSVVNLLIINFVVLYRMLLAGFDIDLTMNSSFLCKFRVYITHCTTLLSRFYIVLACIDRWAMSSANVHRRRLSQRKVAKILIPSLAIGMCVISIHIFIYNNIIQGRCTQTTDTYTAFNNIYNTFLSGLTIPILMVIFGFLTIRNIVHARQRISLQMVVPQIPVNPSIYRRNIKSREYEISIMILVQLAVYLITCLPFPIYLIYSTITMYEEKTNAQIALDNFISFVAYTLVYINFSATFYIYVLTTRIFRKELKKLIRQNYFVQMCFGVHEDPPVMRIDNNHPIPSLQAR